MKATPFQYVGLISSNFRETDVVLAARMRVRSAFDKDGRIQHFVHLCSGDWPDFFPEVVIDHDGETGETRDYLEIDGTRRLVGPVVRIPFHHTHVELKVDVNASEAQVAMDVGDIRLYLR